MNHDHLLAGASKTLTGSTPGPAGGPGPAGRPGVRRPRRGGRRLLGALTALMAKERDPGREVVLLEASRIGWAASSGVRRVSAPIVDPAATTTASPAERRWTPWSAWAVRTSTRSRRPSHPGRLQEDHLATRVALLGHQGRSRAPSSRRPPRRGRRTPGRPAGPGPPAGPGSRASKGSWTPGQQDGRGSWCGRTSRKMWAGCQGPHIRPCHPRWAVLSGSYRRARNPRGPPRPRCRPASPAHHRADHVDLRRDAFWMPDQM